MIFADQAGMGEELAESLEALGNTCLLVYADVGAPPAGTRLDEQGRTGHPQGMPHQQSTAGGKDNLWYVDPAKPTDFERLFADAFQAETSPLRGIIHLWSLDAPDAPELTAEALSEAQVLGCGSVLHLLQGEIRQNLSAKLWLVTRKAVGIEQDQDSLAIAQPPLWGLGKVIAQEHPERWGGLIDGPTVADLVAEIASEDKEDQVVYRAGKRYVARLVKSKVALADGGVLSQSPLQPDHSYLITGGLGALGLKIAHWMVDEGARQLVLTGRRGPSAEAQAVVRQLEEMGAEVLVVSTDISDRAQVARLLAEMDEKMPPLKGIIHAAGILDDGVLAQQDRARFEQVMAPKIVGSWILHTLTQDRPLDFFVCFSSLASLIGSPGQSNYAAANAFMDALAHHRHVLGLPALSINWGAWAKIGLAAKMDRQQRDRLLAMGIDSIDPKQGIAILSELMGKPKAVQVGVSPMDWPRFLKQFSVVPAFLSELSRSLPARPSMPADFIGELKKLPPERQKDYVTAHIRSELNRILGFDPSQPLDSQTGFSDLGMDSLMTVEFKARLEARLEHRLSIESMFNYSTLDSLVNHVATEVLALEPPKESVAGFRQAEDESQQKTLNKFNHYGLKVHRMAG